MFTKTGYYRMWLQMHCTPQEALKKAKKMCKLHQTDYVLAGKVIKTIHYCAEPMSRLGFFFWMNEKTMHERLCVAFTVMQH